MSLLRSARFPAIVLLAAAVLGLIVANSPAGPAVDHFMHEEVGIPGVFELSISHWIQDGLLAIFFFLVAIELQFELTSGQLNSARRALQPAIAAAGGVLVPIGIYLAIAAGSDAVSGWPIPTATDIAFALGVFAIFGRGLPASLRIFLLALAIIDDIVGIVFIAVVFTTGVNLGLDAAAVVTVILFGVLSRRLDGRARVPIAIALVVLAIATWVLVLLSGVHATIAGVALGLAMAQQPALRTRHAHGAVGQRHRAADLRVLGGARRHPRGLARRALAGVLGSAGRRCRSARSSASRSSAGYRMRIGRGDAPKLAFADLLAVGALGGIGFTVSLLLSELAFSRQPEIRDQAILGVLAGSVISVIIAAHPRVAARGAPSPSRRSSEAS